MSDKIVEFMKMFENMTTSQQEYVRGMFRMIEFDKMEEDEA